LLQNDRESLTTCMKKAW